MFIKGDPEGAENVTDGVVWGYREECTLTFLACPLDCSRLMRRGRKQALPRAHKEDKTLRALAGTKWLSSLLRNSKRRT